MQSSYCLPARHFNSVKRSTDGANAKKFHCNDLFSTVNDLLNLESWMMLVLIGGKWLQIEK